MEKSAIPSGFETFSLEELGGNMCYEEMENEDKELVLISAPAQFDINILKGEQFIINGSKMVNAGQPEDEEPLLKWELHSSYASYDKHLNILLPSKLQDKHVLANALSVTLNVVRDILLPTLKSPKKKKSGTRLPKPCGLKARWKPFGSEYPECNKKLNVARMEIDHCMSEELESKTECNKELDVASTIIDYCMSEEFESKKTKKKKKKKKKKVEVDSMQQVNTKIENVECTVNDTNDKKHKKKKKKSKLLEYEEYSVNGKPGATLLDNVNLNVCKTSVKSMAIDQCTSEEFEIKKKKKKKKKVEVDSMQQQQVNVNIENDECAVNDTNKKHKKKKKKSKLQEFDNECNVNGKTEATLLDNVNMNIHKTIVKSKKSKLKTNSELSVSTSTILESSMGKVAKKRKNKTALVDETANKKQKFDTNNDNFANRQEKHINKIPAANFDSDLDSDSEARILGVIPRKRVYSK